ncbi:MAG: hypothetical protein HN909_06015 [Phycisphaerales bacterium]|nr:hypothetical protein [Phycisphaerales bacterium]MBT7171308.1 hypothetical protein [Phycisphaerales bacterium]
MAENDLLDLDMPLDSENEYRPAMKPDAPNGDVPSESRPVGHERLARLEPPPRCVPLLARLTMRLGGGTLGMFGWVFFGFSMIFIWAFAPNIDYTSWTKTWTPAKGEIVALSKTNMSVGGGDHREGTPVYEYVIRHTTPAGKVIRQASYRTGAPAKLRKGYDTALQNGKDEYVPPKPIPTGIERSGDEIRIAGGRTAMMGVELCFVFLFPVVGLGLILGAAWRGPKRIRLLRDGIAASATLKSKEATSTRVNNCTVYKYTFEFTSRDGTAHRVTAKTYRTNTLGDEAFEPVLYDPYFPNEAVLLDALPMKIRLDEMGRLRVPSYKIGGALLPLAVLGGHGLYALHHFGLL